MIAPLPPNEALRLQSLLELAILDSSPEEEFDDLSKLAAYICQTPIGLVSLLDSSRQWFKACYGLTVTETPRDLAFCAYVILQENLVIVPDATKDSRFCDNALVTGPPHIRFYAGMPLATPEGFNLGTLCVIDVEPRTLTAEQQQALRVLARQVTAHIMERRHRRRLQDAIAERTAMETALRLSEARFRNTVDRLAEGVFILDPATGAFVDVNAAVLTMLGYTRQEFMKLNLFEIVFGETQDVFERNVKEIQDRLLSTGRCDLGRRQFRAKNGRSFPVEIRITVVPGDGLDLNAVIVRDVTSQVAYENQLFDYQSQLEEANSKLKGLASTDALTGMKNRACFNERLSEEVDRAKRHDRVLSLILLDVDHFKLFNDSYGHPAGDEVLRLVAGCLQETARLTDVVARYGGEEFAVVLPDTDHAGAMVLAERCRRAIASAPWTKRSVTVSVGVATMSAERLTAETLIAEADQALYRSKNQGRNRVTHGSHLFSTDAPHDSSPSNWHLDQATAER